MTSFRRQIRRLGPYQSLALMSLPLLLVEPLKVGAICVAGKGHWLSGTAMIIVAYALSLLVVERLFEEVKPKLMTLNWFARVWTWFTELRHRAVAWIRAHATIRKNRNVPVRNLTLSRVPVRDRRAGPPATPFPIE